MYIMQYKCRSKTFDLGCIMYLPIYCCFEFAMFFRVWPRFDRLLVHP